MTARTAARRLAAVPEASGAATLDAAKSWLGRFVRWPDEHSANLAVAWAAGCHVTDRDRVLLHGAWPRLIVTGATKDSGKTHCMEMILSLCPRAEMTADITAPALAQMIGTDHPTVGLDEMDLVIGNGAGPAGMRAVLNAGYTPAGCYRRAGKKVPVYGPVVMAGLASVLRGNPALDTLRSRSFMIDMVPAEGGSVERFRSRLHAAGAAAIREALASWGAASATDIVECWPDVPEGLVNRAEEIAEPLLAVAEVAGGEWPERIRAAVRALLLGRDDDGPKVTPAERLIADIRTCWAGSQMRSSELAERLAGLPGGPWRAIFPQPARAGTELARYLAPFGIAPRKIWLSAEGRSAQGYTISQLAPLWSPPEVDHASDLG
ncbi:MAG: DUF3631 domain-containing protein [Streptosporangiaceae bacterium]